MSDTLAGTSPCLLCPGEQHPLLVDAAGSYIIQCPKVTERDDDRIAQLIPVGPGQTVALSRSGRLYKVTFRNETDAVLLPIKLTWLNQAKPV